MKVKRILGLFLILVLTLIFSSTCFAENGVVGVQADYNKQLDSIQFNRALCDADKVKNLVETFLSMKVQDYKQDSDMDYSSILGSSENINFTKNKFKLFKAIKKANNLNILSDEVSFNFIDVKARDNNASVKLYEKYKCMFENSPNGEPSCIGTNYTINLNKTSDKWLITEVITDTPFDRAFNYRNFDLHKLTQQFIQKSNADLDKDSLQKEVNYKNALLQGQNSNISSDVAAATLYQVAYDRNRAASYAAQYWSNYNPLFSNFNPDGGDCQNFGSQCVWYGFGGKNTSTAISNKEFPMITSGNGVWYQAGASNKWSLDSYHRWIAVIPFGTMITNSTTSTEGLYGWINTANVAYAEVGDIIQADWQQNGSFDHTMVVQSVTGTSGSRGINDIWISAHNNDHYNTPLSYMGGINLMRTVRIISEYSSIPPAQYSASLVSSSFPSRVTAGQTYTVSLTYKNTGSQTWDSTNTKIGTSNPRDRSSAFYNPADWLSATRPTALDNVSCATNSNGTYTFIVKAPSTLGHYTEKFELVQENVSWFEGTGDDFIWDVDVVSAPSPEASVTVDNDNGAPGYTTTGSWSSSTSAGYNNGTYQFATAGSSNTATWNLNLPAGTWKISAVFRASTNRATSVKYNIVTASGTQIVYVNQYANPQALVTSVLGTWTFNSGGGIVTLDAAGSSGGTSPVVIADTIIAERVIIIDNDNGAPGYTTTGSWSNSTYAGYNNGTYQFATAGSSSTATWNLNLPAGTWKISAVFRAGTNRATSVKYNIVTASGTQTVYVNQYANPQALVTSVLGTWTFNSGGGTVTLDAAGSSGGTSPVVIADTIIAEYQP